MDDKPKYWFPAKRVGWGWGPPIVWQGWVVMAVFLAALLACALVLLPKRILAFQMAALGLALLLISICYLKGERP